MITEYQKEILLQKVYKGYYTPKRLPVVLYTDTVKMLMLSVLVGSNTDLTTKPTNAIRKKKIIDTMADNIYSFSAAKTHQQMRELSAAVFDSKGNVRDFDDFKDIANNILGKYNENYLRTEMQYVVRATKQAEQWEQFEDFEDVYPYLTYETMQDDRVRDEHAQMQGTTKKVNDPFWDIFYPPNGWNCRCFVLQQESGKSTTQKRIVRYKAPEPEFRNNVGKTGKIFTEEHPYFKIKKEYKNNNNFNMPKKS